METFIQPARNFSSEKLGFEQIDSNN